MFLKNQQMNDRKVVDIMFVNCAKLFYSNKLFNVCLPVAYLNTSYQNMQTCMGLKLCLSP
jgi:hypothetical protein